MALVFAGKFILTDDSLDRHSERVLAKGVDVKNFKKNPVMFYNHHRSSRWGSTEILPIGIWKNVKKEANRIIADAYVDDDGELGSKVLAKIKSGVLKAVSIGFKRVAYSDDAKDKVIGQKGWTITKSQLIEASIVDVPANPSAMAISIAKSIDGNNEDDSSSKGDKPNKVDDLIFYKSFHVVSDGTEVEETKSDVPGEQTDDNNDISKSKKKIDMGLIGDLKSLLTRKGVTVPADATDEQVQELFKSHNSAEEKAAWKAEVKAELKAENDAKEKAAKDAATDAKKTADDADAKANEAKKTADDAATKTNDLQLLLKQQSDDMKSFMQKMNERSEEIGNAIGAQIAKADSKPLQNNEGADKGVLDDSIEKTDSPTIELVEDVWNNKPTV